MTLNTPMLTEKTYYTPEEYLELENQSEIKHEYLNGEIIAMTGGTTNHNKLALKIAAKLLAILEEQGYEIYIGDVNLWIETSNRYTYPDVMVVKDRAIYQGKNQTIITNPLVIIEVLSKSTANYDQGDKFDAYRTIPSFQEYVLVSQTEYYIKQFVKNEQGKWVLTDYRGESEILKLESVDFEISLKQLYQYIDFTQSED
ncbi:Uma2 family endonuclease [Anabaena sp. UHCC 0451]|uniref:Uma2 family endonuclease n=1 Tax=Anabaena sp. UHCC 0451 TaxID=2055235 RepID=UPI002B2215B9|nr:Uma2 family endonuclease [Anabaena sp. UHCC 0451]MEA5577520.1 Uma2 family endonuclease [Anabaena sp. UHCC 0451]